MSVLVSLIALLSGSTGEPQEQSRALAREHRWIYRDVLGDGSAKVTAAFLAWDYSEVVFTATCDRQTRELVIWSRLDADLHSPSVEPLEISSALGSVKLRTEIVDGYIEGRTEITEVLTKILETRGEIEVFVPSDMGEPFYVGQAQPLRKVGLGCKS